MKLRKRIAALGAAMTMAVSMMSIGASADDYTASWTPLFYAPYSANIHTSSSASVKARNNGSTINVNITIQKSGTGHVHAYAPGCSNAEDLYVSGNYGLKFSEAAFPKGTWKTVTLSLQGYGYYSSINASGNISN